MAEKKKNPSPNNPGPEYLYQQGLKSGKFLIQKCNACSTYIFYHRLLCPNCGSKNVIQLEAKGGGTVYSTSVVRQRPERGGDYNLALIDLDEGPRMLSKVEGIKPSDVKIGMKVRARVDISGDEPIVVFDQG